MHAGALTIAVASSASGAALEPGASLFAPDKGGSGEVDAFTQALAALLGLPAQSAPQAAATSATPAANATKDMANASQASPAFTPLAPVSTTVADSPAALPIAAQAPFALPPSGAHATDQSLLADVVAQTTAAAPGATPPARVQPTGAASPAVAAQTPAPKAPPGPSMTPAAGTQVATASLATFSLAGRIQSEIVAPAGGVAADATADAPSAALTPLVAGASRLNLLPQPASDATAKPPPSAQVKTAAKTDSATSGTQTASAATAEDAPSVEPPRGAANPADDQSQESGEHASGGTAAQSQGPQPGATNTNPNAAATTLAVAPGVATAQSATTLSTTPATPIAAQLATQVVKAVDGKSTHFDIALQPAGLGRVDVKLQIDPQGQISAQFSFDTAHAAADAKAQAGQLQQALEQAGFTVGQGGLSFDVGGQGAGLARQQSEPAPQSPSGPSQPAALADATSAGVPQALIHRPVSGLDITI